MSLRSVREDTSLSSRDKIYEIRDKSYNRTEQTVRERKPDASETGQKMVARSRSADLSVEDDRIINSKSAERLDPPHS